MRVVLFIGFFFYYLNFKKKLTKNKVISTFGFAFKMQYMALLLDNMNLFVQPTSIWYFLFLNFY